MSSRKWNKKGNFEFIEKSKNSIVREVYYTNTKSPRNIGYITIYAESSGGINVIVADVKKELRAEFRKYSSEPHSSSIEMETKNNNDRLKEIIELIDKHEPLLEIKDEIYSYLQLTPAFRLGR